jgi:hypothetical protein
MVVHLYICTLVHLSIFPFFHLYSYTFVHLYICTFVHLYSVRSPLYSEQNFVFGVIHLGMRMMVLITMGKNIQKSKMSIHL